MSSSLGCAELVERACGLSRVIRDGSGDTVVYGKMEDARGCEGRYFGNKSLFHEGVPREESIACFTVLSIVSGNKKNIPPCGMFYCLLIGFSGFESGF